MSTKTGVKPWDVSQEIMDYLGIEGKYINSVNIKLRPDQYPTVVVKYFIKHESHERGTSFELKTSKYALKEV